MFLFAKKIKMCGIVCALDINEKPEILDTIQTSGKIEENTDKLLSEVIINYKKSNFEKK